MLTNNQYRYRVEIVNARDRSFSRLRSRDTSANNALTKALISLVRTIRADGRSGGVSESKKDWIIRLPKSLVCDTSVSLEARITYVVLMGFEGKNGAPAFPELETIAWILKRHRTKVQRYIRELQSVGWLDKKRFKNKDGQFQSVRYDLLRHRSHDSCLRPQSRKSYTVSPTAAKPPTVNVTTNKSQF